MSRYENNLACLREHYPTLFQELLELKNMEETFEILNTPHGEKTVLYKYNENNETKQLFLHSKYQPGVEGERFAKEKMGAGVGTHIIYGFGLGYHIEGMANLLVGDSLLYVFDLDIRLFAASLHYRDFTQLFSNPRIFLNVTADVSQLSGNIAELLQNDRDVNMVVHTPSVNVMPASYENLKYLLLDVNLMKTVGQDYLGLLQSNYQINRKYIKDNIGTFFGQYPGKPAIIVGAGPSLNKNKYFLPEVLGKALIISVGKALKPLLSIGVKPDFLITIDPSEETYQQIEGLEDLDIPFILLATAAGINARKYRGPKYMASQYPAYLVPGDEKFLVEPGGSVSTTALDIAIRMGCDPIVYVGQDLAYTGEKHHCDATMHENNGITYLKNMRTIEGWNGEKLPSTLGMISFRNWITKRVKSERKTTFINATEGGAFIPGLKHMTLRTVIDDYLTADLKSDEGDSNVSHF